MGISMNIHSVFQDIYEGADGKVIIPDRGDTIVNIYADDNEINICNMSLMMCREIISFLDGYLFQGFRAVDEEGEYSWDVGPIRFPNGYEDADMGWSDLYFELSYFKGDIGAWVRFVEQGAPYDQDGDLFHDFEMNNFSRRDWELLKSVLSI